MGFSPDVIDNMSIWEFFVCVDGYAEKQGQEAPAPEPSDDLVRLIEGEI